ncbi:MAG TPA: four helix bundle protein [Vicinamibacterales bacterium]|jgi:four helix bundle protein
MESVNHYTKLFVWKVGDQIRQDVAELTSRPAFARDLKARSQADDAANSICRNIAEGFACETHKDFARYLGYSRRSLNELRDAMRGAMVKGYISGRDLQPIDRRAFHLRRALTNFIAYLKATPDDNRMTAHGGKRPRKAGSSRRRKRASDWSPEPKRVDER